MEGLDEERIMDYVKDHLDTIVFKTLRFDEVELTDQEKLREMTLVLHNTPGLFLSRWGRYLSQPMLSLFESIKGDYEVDFYLDSLLFQKFTQPESSQTFKKSRLRQLAQNRRYEYLKRKLQSSDYFSDEQMQLRDPVLYEQYVGRYVPTQEKLKPFEKDVTLVDRIYSNMDQRYVHDHLDRQKMIDEEQFEEEESEEESEEEYGERSTPAVITKKKNKDIDMDEADDDIDSDDDGVEKSMDFREEKRLELIKLFEERFLAGKDDFDYDMIDYNEEYDDLDQQEQDIQDRYFDED